jgi:RimJ/RimL family protein N-acetyltransferase
MSSPLVETRSLLLRHFVAEDAPRVLELNAEPTTRRWLPSHVYADLEEARATLAFLVGSYAAPGDPRLGPYVLGIELRDTGQLVGHVGFSPLDDDVEVSYAVAESVRGRGFGTEALHHACDWACRTFGLPGVVATTASENLASRRLLDKARFAHVKDELTRFQGAQEAVSRYRRGVRHLNPDHFLETPAGRDVTPERNAWAWQQCFAALEASLGAWPGSSPRLYLMVGAQAAGKSTWARDKVLHEPDAIVFDAILVKQSERAPILAIAKRHQVPAVAVWCRATLEACLRRNRGRPADEVVDETGLRNVHAALEPPSVAEGFAQVLEVEDR